MRKKFNNFSKILILYSFLLGNLSLINAQNVPGVCFCVTSGFCNSSTGSSGNLDGSG